MHNKLLVLQVPVNLHCSSRNAFNYFIHLAINQPKLIHTTYEYSISILAKKSALKCVKSAEKSLKFNGKSPKAEVRELEEKRGRVEEVNAK